MLLLLFITTAVIAYQRSRPEQAARIEIIDDTPVPTSSLQSDEQNEIDGWKTYENEYYNFSLKYRPDLDVSFNEEYNNLFLTSGLINDPYENNFNMSIQFLENEDGITPLQYFEERCKDPELPEFLITDEAVENCLSRLENTKEEYVVDGKSGIRAPIFDYEQGALLTVIPHNDYIIALHVGGSGEAGSEPSKLAVETYDKILSTFEFTKTKNPIVEVRFEGGLCPESVCSTTYTFHENGEVMMNGEVRLTLNENRVNNLKELISEANFEDIRSNPFSGTCPSAYDGREATYTFYPEDKQEIIPSCTYNIDDTMPLFAEVGRIIDQIQ